MAKPIEKLNPPEKAPNIASQDRKVAVLGTDAPKVPVEVAAKNNRDKVKESVDYSLGKQSLADFLKEPVEKKLERVSNPPVLNVEKGSGITIDFHGNKVLENQVSAGDILPMNVQNITVESRGKKYENANRQGLTGEFFTEKGERVKIYTTSKITINSVLNEEAIQKKQSDNKVAYENYIKDPAHKRPETIPETEYENISKQSIEKGVDPHFMIALRRAENGIASGKHFGVILDGIKGDALQLTMALKIVARYESRFREKTQQPIQDADGKYPPQFIAFFSHIYAPRGAENDPTNLNKNHLPALIEFYYGDKLRLQEAEDFYGKVQDIFRVQKDARKLSPEELEKLLKDSSEKGKYVVEAVSTAMDQKDVRGAHCWDWVDQIYGKAGVAHTTIYQDLNYTGKECPERVKKESEQWLPKLGAGDWIYINNRNSIDTHGCHSGVFMGWENEGNSIARIASCPSSGSTGNIRNFDLKDMPLTHISKPV